MYFRIAETVGYCIAGTRIVLLDMTSNRYFGLPDAAEAAFKDLIDGGGEVDRCAEKSLRYLIDAGFIIPADSRLEFRSPVKVEFAEKDVAGLARTTASPRYIVLALWWLLYTHVRLHLTPFSAIVDKLRSGTPPGTAAMSDNGWKARQIAAAFDLTGYMIGRTDRCLARSLAMLSMCRSLQVAVILVIGVRSDPFTAHCWIQLGNTVLNDSAENVRNFTPLLVLE